MTFRTGDLSAADRIDTTVAHPARRYNYLLGGKDNFAADRASGDALATAMPTIRLAAVENRMFLQRVVRFLARQGVRQFLDIGTGIPTADNTHEVAQAIDPTARVVYVDNDPIVLAHARRCCPARRRGVRLTSTPTSASRRRSWLMPDLRSTLDLAEPVALMLVAVLHFIRDDEDPKGILARLVAALPSGSYVVASHVTWEHLPPDVVAKLEANNQDGRFRARSTEQFADLLDGLDLVEPGIVSVARWRADDAPQPRPSVSDVSFNCAVARVR